MKNSDKSKYRESDAIRETTESDGQTEKPSQREIDKGADSIIANKEKWHSGSDKGPDFHNPDDRHDESTKKQESSDDPTVGEWSSGGKKGPDFLEAYKKDMEESDKE